MYRLTTGRNEADHRSPIAPGPAPGPSPRPFGSPGLRHHPTAPGPPTAHRRRDRLAEHDHHCDRSISD